MIPESVQILREEWGWVVEAGMLLSSAAAFVFWTRQGILQVVLGCAWYALARLAGAEWLAVAGPAAAALVVLRSVLPRKKVQPPDLEAFVSAAVELSKKRSGAIIAIERSSPLTEYYAGGTRLEAALGREALLALFAEGSPLRNGAVIVRGRRIETAGCLLPLSENPDLSKSLGTRHRAALGVSERTDAVAVVVSAETGTISVAIKGELMQGLSVDDLKHVLADLFES